MHQPNYGLNTSIRGLACRYEVMNHQEKVLIKLQIQFFLNNVEQFKVQQHLKLLYYCW